MLEPRKQRRQWAEIEPLYSSLGNKSEILSQNKKKNKQNQKQNWWVYDICSCQNPTAILLTDVLNDGFSSTLYCVIPYRTVYPTYILICFTLLGWVFFVLWNHISHSLV